MRRIATLLTLTALGATALTGCGDGGHGGGLTTADVAGRYYVSTNVTGHTMVPGSTLTLSFNDTEQVSASSGCNAVVGLYQIKSGILRMNPNGATTMMACEEALQQQEEWFKDLLANGVHIKTAADRGLTLTQDGVRIDLKDSPEGAGAPRAGVPAIVGTPWKLRQIVEAGGKSGPAVPASGPPTLEFTDGGRATVYTGCNRGAADAEVRDDGFIVFGRMTLTRMACKGNAAALEKQITTVLRGKVAAGFEGNDLSLVRDGTRLVYTAP